MPPKVHSSRISWIASLRISSAITAQSLLLRRQLARADEPTARHTANASSMTRIADLNAPVKGDEALSGADGECQCLLARQAFPYVGPVRLIGADGSAIPDSRRGFGQAF